MRWTGRILIRILLGIMIGMLAFGPPIVAAQQIKTVELPESVVLVLKLISRTQVEATTGVVIHSSGLVLIPAEFGMPDDEIVVLDGGTDIVLHGRPATMIRNSLANGLAVLAVPELNRIPLLVSGSEQLPSDVLHFATFPPARTVAERTQSLGLELYLESSKLDKSLTISIDTPLPNVAGPLFDRCGLLSGFNLATGTETLEGPDYPRTLLGQELKDILLGFKLDIGFADCEKVIKPQLTAQSGAVQEETVGTSTDELPDQLEEEQVSAEETPIATPPGIQTPEHPADNQKAVDSPASRNLSGWVAILAVLAAIFIVLMRRKSLNSSLLNTASHKEIRDPDTEHLLAAGNDNLSSSGFRLQSCEDISGLPVFSEGTNALLCLQRTNQASQSFKSYHEVSSKGLRMLIADEGSTDILINEKDFSGPQAGIEVRGTGNHYQLLLSNRGEASGVSIQNTPCLAGELLYIEPDDVVAVGHFEISFKLIGRPKEQS